MAKNICLSLPALRPPSLRASKPQRRPAGETSKQRLGLQAFSWAWPREPKFPAEVSLFPQPSHLPPASGSRVAGREKPHRAGCPGICLLEMENKHRCCTTHLNFPGLARQLSPWILPSEPPSPIQKMTACEPQGQEYPLLGPQHQTTLVFSNCPSL